MSNLHIFATEKKAQRQRKMFNLKYNIKSYFLRVWNFPYLSLPW
jgi:hypothetical protein